MVFIEKKYWYSLGSIEISYDGWDCDEIYLYGWNEDDKDDKDKMTMVIVVVDHWW